MAVLETPNGKLPPSYWENRARLDFKRTSAMNAVNAASAVVSACIQSGIEKLDVQQAMDKVIRESLRLRKEVYADLEETQNGNAEAH